MEPETIHCKVPEGVSPSEAIPPDPDNSEVLDRCSHYLNFSRSTNVTVSGCPMGWHYSDEVYSIIHEVGLSSGVSTHHDDVIKWKHFPRYWPFVRGSHRSPVNSPHKGQWRGALMFSLISSWLKSWVNIREAGNLRRRRAHYDVTVMLGGVAR